MTLTPAAFRALRDELAMSQKRLGALMGIEHETICRWEKGKRPVPPWAALALQQIAHQEGMKAEGREIIAAMMEPDPRLADLKWIETDAPTYAYAPMIAPVEEFPDRPGLPEALEDAISAVLEAADIGSSRVHIPLSAWTAFLDATNDYYASR